MAGDRLDPLRLDRGQPAAEQARGVDQLGGDQPAPRLLRQVRARMAPELDAARAQVPLVIVGLAADVAQEARQHRLVHLLVGGRRAVQAPAVLGHHGVELAVDVAPLAHPARVDEALAQALLLLAVAELVGVDLLPGLGRIGMAVAAAALLDPLPELQVAHELGALVVEFFMLLVGGLLRFQRPVAHVLHAQGAGDDQHLVQRLAAARLQDHAAHARVQRQLGEFPADGGQLVGLVDRAQLAQQRVAIGNRLARRRLDEGKVLHQTEAERLHPQDHPGERGAQDLRVGEARAALEVLLVVEPDADAVGDPAAAAGALVGRRLADGFHLQLLDLVAVAVALDPRGAGVDHIADARHRERRLGHVGGQHDALGAAGLEDAVLLGLGQPREQRQDVGVAVQRLVAEVLAQVVGRLADLALARQEDQDVAGAGAAPEVIDRIGDRVVQIEVLCLLEGLPALLDRKGAAADHDHRRRPLARGEVLREALGIDGGRGDDDLQVRPARQDSPQIAKQEVDVEAALVRLVDDQRVVGLQQRIGLRLGQQDAVGHQLDRGAGLQPVLEAHLVADHLAQRRLQLLGDALGHRTGGDAARLGVADQAGAARPQAAAQLERDLGQLRRFP